MCVFIVVIKHAGRETSAACDLEYYIAGIASIYQILTGTGLERGRYREQVGNIDWFITPFGFYRIALNSCLPELTFFA